MRRPGWHRGDAENLKATKTTLKTILKNTEDYTCRNRLHQVQGTPCRPSSSSRWWRYLWLSPYGCPEDCSSSDSSGDCCLPGAAFGLMSWLCGANAYSTTRSSPQMRRAIPAARRHQPHAPSQTSYANRLPSVDSLWKKGPGTRPQCPTTRRHTTNHPRPGYAASLGAGRGR